MEQSKQLSGYPNGVKIEGDKITLYLENIKCGGCANSISKALEVFRFT